MSSRGTKRKKLKVCLPGQKKMTSFLGTAEAKEDGSDGEIGEIVGSVHAAGTGPASVQDAPTSGAAEPTVPNQDQVAAGTSGEEQEQECSLEEQNKKRAQFLEQFKKKEKKKKNGGHLVGYQEKWETMFDWLYPVNDYTGLMCRVCKRHNMRQKNGEYIWSRIPSTSLRTDKVWDHHRSEQHKKAVALDTARIAAEVNGGIRQAMAVNVSLNREAVKAALKVVYHLAKKEIPHHTNFKDLVKFASTELGCDVFNRLNVAGNATYTSSTVVDEFLAVLGTQLEEDQLNTIKGSPFLGLMCDETVDISTTNELVLYCRCIDGHGEFQAHFMKVIALKDGKANTIKAALSQYLEQKDLSIQKVAGFGSDGAACMIGNRSGVATQLKEENAKIVSIHCIAHRLALAVGQAGNKVKFIGDVFKPNLMSLFLYYNGSAVRSEGLKEIQKILQELELKLKQPKDVRWLSHDAATDALYKSLPSVLVHLNQEMNKGVAAANGLWSWLRTYKTIATLYLLCDVLPHMSALSKCFQQKRLDLTEIHNTVDRKKDVVRKARDQPLEELRLSKLDEELGPGGRLDGLDILVSERDRQEFSSVRRQFIDNLLENLEERFPQTELLSAFGVLDPANLKTPMPGGYGWPEIEKLTAFYNEEPYPIDSHAIRDEWIAFRQHLGSYRQKTPKEMCQVLSANPTLACQYPNIASLYARMVVIPVHTADCERAFSTLKRVKTRLRSTLTTANLNHLLRISIMGPAMDSFDFDKAVARWGSLRNRRLLV
ncbi:zinc finger protein 862-like [Branchiostoma floridae x Branchiostoma japonicum]